MILVHLILINSSSILTIHTGWRTVCNLAVHDTLKKKYSSHLTATTVIDLYGIEPYPNTNLVLEEGISFW
jgi:hypothetical protein